jgi:hypothetical protein
MKKVTIPIVLALALMASLLVGCSCQSNIEEPLQVSVVEHTNGCFSSEKEGTAAVWDGDDILATTIVQTPVPCYEVKSIEAKQVGNWIAVEISFQRKEEYCIECLGFQKLTYRILSPDVEEINLGVAIEVNGKKIKQTSKERR